jgi:hypothetical protein
VHFVKITYTLPAAPRKKKRHSPRSAHSVTGDFAIVAARPRCEAHFVRAQSDADIRVAATKKIKKEAVYMAGNASSFILTAGRRMLYPHFFECHFWIKRGSERHAV